MSNASFSTSAYVRVHHLTAGHCNTVNCLSFSPDGSHLASGGDDHALAIWNILKGRLLYRLLFKSAVDSVLWHPIHPDTVIVGCANGTLLQIHDFSLTQSEHASINLGARNTVHCLDYDVNTSRLAIGMGEEVHITKEHNRNQYFGDLVIPPPSEPEGFQGIGDQRIRAMAVYFHDDGQSLIVSYLSHGIICWDPTKRTQRWRITMPSSTPNIGGSALSPDHRRLAVYNLATGVDIYPAAWYHKKSPTKTCNFSTPPRTKHTLKVTYVHKGHGLLSGTTDGTVHIWDAQTGDLYQALPHAGDLIQSVSATIREKASYIATASAGKGQNTYIEVWKARIIHEKENKDLGATVADLVHAVTGKSSVSLEEVRRCGTVIAVVGLLVCVGLVLATGEAPWNIAWGALWDSSSAAASTAIRDTWQWTEAAFTHGRTWLILTWAALARMLKDSLREWLFPELAGGVVVRDAHADL